MVLFNKNCLAAGTMFIVKLWNTRKASYHCHFSPHQPLSFLSLLMTKLPRNPKTIAFEDFLLSKKHKGPAYTWFSNVSRAIGLLRWTAETHRCQHLCLSCVSKVSRWRSDFLTAHFTFYQKVKRLETELLHQSLLPYKRHTCSAWTDWPVNILIS